jgi:hypothetical protein
MLMKFWICSHIIQRVNEVYGIELSDEDRLDLKNVAERMNKNEELQQDLRG